MIDLLCWVCVCVLEREREIVSVQHLQQGGFGSLAHQGHMVKESCGGDRLGGVRLALGSSGTSGDLASAGWSWNQGRPGLEEKHQSSMAHERSEAQVCH